MPALPPSLSIINRQRKLRVDLPSIRPLLESALAAAGADGDVSLLLVSDRAIHALNRAWRGIDRPTDCISFPAREGPGGAFAGPLLGDIVISVETAIRQGLEHAAPRIPRARALRDELVFLFVHSLLHLMGHDHADAAQKRSMRAAERHVLSRLRSRERSW
jgi:probable rRNA maturation factor